MACGCETYSCFDVLLVECASTITLPIVASETGTWKMIQEFAGSTLRTDITVTNGVNLVVPASVFNENYTHVVKFYKVDDTIFNNTCYKLNIMPTVFTNPSSTPITAGDLNGASYTGNGTATQVFSDLSGKQLLTIEMGLQVLTPDMFTQMGTSVTLDLDGMLFQGTIVLNWK